MAVEKAKGTDFINFYKLPNMEKDNQLGELNRIFTGVDIKESGHIHFEYDPFAESGKEIRMSIAPHHTRTADAINFYLSAEEAATLARALNSMHKHWLDNIVFHAAKRSVDNKQIE
ncbi:MAG: hypothetical protein Q8922_14930 [Bacteroidota bacterium]|nr:hypothetical protein [Bacteroidota bacterium]MDP4232805.1 hypothetical protein [Bacteroidota bacterium]MDP4242514.1 hypothetical protein [Bacteroidota bacterium]MDP4289211.1 hypothetical protein [Bacteroidota bacterium]